MKRAVSVALFSCALLACRMPWTVRPIDAKEPEANTNRPFDAARYVASIWDSKVIPAAAGAPGFAQARSAAHPLLIKDTVRVLRVDAERQRLLLDIAPFDGKPDAELAIGQIRGTALRDALPFVQFSQFVNQVDFAHAANALNDRAEGVAASVKGIAPGSVVSFAGALDVASGNSLPEIVPVILTREPSRP